ncbi:MAG: DNA mismatch repair endonuclease MutL [Elusimicrobia bacterium]|nr:DNA mismatch repair endonuclease MutL [Elusimicrobiota bacterium]
MNIKILSEETINKIAAGEVIERPANVVKELVENSLDAGGTNLEINIEGSGKKLIRVKDDGTGMSKEDILLSVQRHATSKINEFNDLEQLNTLGFRGEALPSIAAVSKLAIQSQTKDKNSAGWEITLKGGKLLASSSWAGSGGTVVEVSDLFFNTPARAKFLKSDATEKNHMFRLIEEMSLARPDVSFTIYSDGKKVLSAPKTKTVLERLMDVLGNDFASGLLPVEINHPNIKIKAYITSREKSLPNRNFQFLFVNKRPVSFTKSITHSLYEAYRENLAVGRHPGAVLFIEIDPSALDVNIHPTKREVKFSKEQEIHQLLYMAMKGVISSESSSSIPLISGNDEKIARKDNVFSRNEPIYHAKKDYNSKQFSITDFKEVYGRQQEFNVNSEGNLNLKVLGQVHNLYILCQYDGSMLIVDQHAAQERIRYEKYLSDWNKKRIPVQPMLLPITLEMPPSRAGLLKENKEILKNLGIEIEEFGNKTLRITGLPAVLGTKVEINDLLNEIVEALSQETKLPETQKIEKIIRAACRSSVKAGDVMNIAEMNALLKGLFTCKAPYTCPHGRPTTFKITYAELEKYFGRK